MPTTDPDLPDTSHPPRYYDNTPADYHPGPEPESDYLSWTQTGGEADSPGTGDSGSPSSRDTGSVWSSITQTLADQVSSQLNKAQELLYNLSTPSSSTLHTSSSSPHSIPDSERRGGGILVAGGGGGGTDALTYNRTVNQSAIGSALGNLSWDSIEDSQKSTSTPFPGYIDIKNFSFDLDYHLKQLDLFGNYTDCWNASDCWVYNSSVAPPQREGNVEVQDPSLPNYWILMLLVFPLFTVFGNALVVTSVYRERTLRTVTNYFIVSLAIADIMVGILVMPLAVYVEVNNGDWELGNILCDSWVAMDVMGCTASILNLTAISVDRFIAVTQPIRYAKHKNSKRVHVMLVLTWVVSVAISSPIAMGMNYTDARLATPKLCIFYNSEFLICSSMGSFYIPCIIMLILYWRIFRAIHLRAKKAAMKMTKNIENKSYGKVIENKAQVVKETNNSHHHNTDGDSSAEKTLLPPRTQVETSFTNLGNTTTTDTEDGTEAVKSPLTDVSDTVIPNDKSTDFMLSPVSEDSRGEGYSAPATIEVETQFTTMRSPTSPDNLLTPNPSPRKHPLGFKNHFVAKDGKKEKIAKEASPKHKSVTKFNFHLRHSKKKKTSLAVKREKKATTTLAIVLGVFLLCWLPFFTVNVMTAICIKLDAMDRPECNIDPSLMSFFVWLGYINSFLNPVIYTIFNMDFRKAFKKILVDMCGKKCACSS